MRLTIFLILAAGLCFPIVIFAETIVLKSGETIEAKVTDTTEDYITVEIDGAYVSYGVSEIESINGWVCDKEEIKRFLSTRTGTTQIVTVLPEKWIQIKDPTGKYGRAYVTSDKPSQALMVVYREIWIPNQTALQWAQDEAKARSMDDQGLSMGMEVKKVTSPQPVGLDNFDWFVLEVVIGSSDNIVLKSQQYYAKIDDDYIIEVVVGGSPELFESAVEKEIIDYLSSFRVAKVSSKEDMEEISRLAHHEDRINKDLANFTIASPKYTKQINYMREDPPLTITAPKDWHMALKKEYAGGIDRAFFCKYDPEKPLSQGAPGPFETPYIKVSFLPNPESLPSIVSHNSLLARLKSMGAAILIDEEITVDGRLGSHLAASVPGENLTIDVYIFTAGDTFLSVRAACESDEFEETKKEIKEAIDSIRFSSYFDRKTVNTDELTDELLEKGGTFIEDIKLMQGEEKK